MNKPYGSNTSGQSIIESTEKDPDWTPLVDEPPTVLTEPNLKQFKGNPVAKGAWDID